MQADNPITIYQTDDHQIRIEVKIGEDSVWLTQAQMALLFERERSVMTKHIRNVFKEGELLENQVCANFAHTADDGKTYQVEHYNLDVIISVGYRVKWTALVSSHNPWKTGTSILYLCPESDCPPILY